VLVAVRSVTPDFDPNAADDPAWLEVEADAPKMRKARTASKTVSPVIPHGERHDKLFHEGCRQGQTTFVEYTKPESKKGEIIPNHQGNIRLALTRLGLHLSYNAFAAKDLVTYQGLTQLLDDPVVHRAWLSIDEVFHFRPSLNFFEIVVGDLARQQHFHPVREYLDALTWDREPRINTWLATYAGAVDTTTQSEADDSLTYLEAVSSILFIAAVRRIRTPGAKFDELLILESPQGTLKSSALRALCLDDAWFSDDLPLGVDAKQVIERTAGKWIIEATELQGYTNAQVDHLKGMTARQTDGPVRLAYGHRSTEVPRQFVMIGTTNKLTEYLRDSTGNRRFWPVRITRFDVAALTRDRDQLWAEAAYREAAGELIRLPEALWAAAGVEQEARRQVDPWEEVIDQQIDLTDPAVLAVPVEALWAALGDAGKQFKRNDAERLAHILQRNGFTRKKKIDVNYISVKYGVVQIVKAAGRRWVWLREGADPASVEFRREPSVRRQASRQTRRVRRRTVPMAPMKTFPSEIFHSKFKREELCPVCAISVPRPTPGGGIRRGIS
jgi:predicted P-loop ATPase